MKLHRSTIAIAVTAALASGIAGADGTSVSGFADIVYTAKSDSNKGTGGGTDPNANGAERKFGANAEVDFAYQGANAVTFNLDADLDLTAGNSGSTSLGGDSGRIEQAYFGWKINDAVTVLGGVFNDPIGYDAEDAPNMNFSSHDVIYNILNHQTALTGDNVAGVAVAGAVGPVTLTGAVLNETAQTSEENSVALVANFSPVKDLDLELGYVSQASQDTRDKMGDPLGIPSAGNVVDFNAAYKYADFNFGVDYLKPQEIVKSAYAVWAGYNFGTSGFGVKARIENVKWKTDFSTAGDAKRTTLYASYQVAKNLSAALEVADGDDKNPVSAVTGIAADKTTTLELIAKFN